MDKVSLRFFRRTIDTTPSQSLNLRCMIYNHSFGKFLIPIFCAVILFTHNSVYAENTSTEQLTTNKLISIVFAHCDFENAPLTKVIDFLNKESIALDPEKKGVKLETNIPQEELKKNIFYHAPGQVPTEGRPGSSRTYQRPKVPH